MKPAVQVPLIILVVAALVYIMYSQSKDKPDGGNAASEQVESAGEVSKASLAESGAASNEESAADDAIIDMTPAKEKRVVQKQVGQAQTKRVSVGLRDRRRNMFRGIDVAEKDNIVSKEEHDRFFRNAFNFYDKNDDDRLTGRELMQVTRLPRHADVNKDGILTREEFLNQFERFFVTMDVDKSGDLTEQEFVR